MAERIYARVTLTGSAQRLAAVRAVCATEDVLPALLGRETVSYLRPVSIEETCVELEGAVETLDDIVDVALRFGLSLEADADNCEHNFGAVVTYDPQTSEGVYALSPWDMWCYANDPKRAAKTISWHEDNNLTVYTIGKDNQWPATRAEFIALRGRTIKGKP